MKYVPPATPEEMRGEGIAQIIRDATNQAQEEGSDVYTVGEGANEQTGVQPPSGKRADEGCTNDACVGRGVAPPPGGFDGW